MKSILSMAAAAVLLVAAPSTCLAVWDVEQVTKERAKELGMEFRSTAGQNQVKVELEFPLAGDLARLREVILRVGQGDNPLVIVPLKEDRSKPGRVVVGFWASRASVETASLKVMVPGMPGTVGGTMYDLRVNDFVDLKNVR